jgi:hypothetical protein
MRASGGREFGIERDFWDIYLFRSLEVGLSMSKLAACGSLFFAFGRGAAVALHPVFWGFAT